MSETIVRTVQVWKASSVALIKGEAIADFGQRMNEAVQAYAIKKHGAMDSWSTYVRDVYPDNVVYSTCVKDEGGKSKSKLYKTSYTRDPNSGAFTFSDPIEVRQVVSYEPVLPSLAPKDMAVSKSEVNVAPAVTSSPSGTIDSALATVGKKDWSASYVNDLPDAAFAYIAPGGKKDAQGKTTPRARRMLPHHDASVKSGTENDTVDLPHLRNALARLNQIAAGPAAKAAAKAHLQAHAKELLASDNNMDAGVKKSLEDLLTGE